MNTGTAMLGSYQPVTPRDEVFRRGAMRVLRFRPVREDLAPIPVVLVPSIINRSFILDLHEGGSFAAHLVAQGLDVYLVDWGEPGPAEAWQDLEAYSITLMRQVIRAVRRASGAPGVHLLGYCLGGTFALIAGARGLPGIVSIAALTTPVELSEPGPLGRLTDPRLIDLDRLEAAYPVVPGAMLWTAFQSLDPLGQVRKLRGLPGRLKERETRERFLAHERWLSDPVAMTVRALRDVVQRLYRDNALARGTLRLRGRPLRLADGKVPVINLIAQSDTLVPPPCSRPLAELWGGEVETHELRGGHIGVTVGRRAATGMWAAASSWFLARQSA